MRAYQILPGANIDGLQCVDYPDRDLALDAVRTNTNLPPQYWRLFNTWVALGVPAFIAFLAIFWLMVAKPI